MFSMGRASIGSCKIIIIFVLLTFSFSPHPCSFTSEGMLISIEGKLLN